MAQRFHNIRIDEFAVMPSHFHAIVQIVSDNHSVGAPLVGAPLQQFAESAKEQSHEEGPQGFAPTGIATNDKKTVGDIVGAFHSIVTVEYIRMVKMNKWPPLNKRIWQRNYWEHIIRNDLELFRIRNYIRNNPKNWDKDDKCVDHGSDVIDGVAMHGDEL